MQHPISTALILSSLLATAVTALAQGTTPHYPDSVVLTSGKEIHGLLVQKSRDAVTIQNASGETSIPRTGIARILDTADDGAYFLDVHHEGTLPPWRVLVNDLRHNDAVRSMDQIPATVIKEGVFRNVPYLSFRINGDLELNIYGDPNDPAAIEIGIYGKRHNDKRLRTICREFFASYLPTKEAIQALYALNPKGDRKTAGALVLETTPPDAPDAYNAYWVSVFSPERIEKSRISMADYAKLTVPMESVVDKEGKVRDLVWTKKECLRAMAQGRRSVDGRLFARGFYRDDAGVFHVVARNN